MHHMNLGGRIKQVREELRWSQEELARRAGMPGRQQTIQALEMRDSKRSDYAAVLCNALGVNLQWALTGDGPKWSDDHTPGPAGHRVEEPPPDAGEFTFVPRVYGPMLSAGPGRYAWKQEVVDGSHAFRREWMQQKGLHKNECRLISVKGDSMAPYLQDGDIVLVNMADRAVRSGEVYAIAVDDELRVKRLVKRSDGSLEVRSDNPSPQYPAEVLDGPRIERLNVIGRVVWRGG